MLRQTTIQEADLTPFPPASLLGSPCWSAPPLPHSTPGQTNPRVRGCGGRGVCARTSGGLVSSVQQRKSAPHREDAIRDVKSFLFFLLFSSLCQDYTSLCVCMSMCEETGCCPINEWVYVKACEFVLQDGDSLSHWQAGRQAGSVVCTSL